MATSTTETEVSKRKKQGEQQPLTFADDLQRELKAMLLRVTTTRFPNPKYQRDPVGFFRQVLGVEPWDKQIEIINAVRDYDRVAVCSGHKVGKSNSVAGLALWFFCSYPDARCVMSSTTSRQVDQILWRELRIMRARSGRCTDCKAADPEGLLIPRPCPHSAMIEGDQGELARTGLKSPDFREIVGFTAKEAEAVAGVSGRHLLYLVDEASGVPDLIFEAIEGNRAGGAKLVLVGNGTRNSGEFFEAFHSKSQHYKTLRISSEQSPNVVQGKIVIPGLATREWILEKQLEWNVDSPLYRVRVKGEHATHEEGKIFSLHMIEQAEQRWPETPEAGRLYIGLDPAGESGSGDETVFVARRGLRMLLLRAHLGLNTEQHVTQLLQLLQPPLLLPRETPVVVLDRGGQIGHDLARALRDYLDQHPDAFDLVAIRASDLAVRKPDLFHTMRDELAGNLEAWMREGGAILEDSKLERELHALEWKQDVKGRLKLKAKDDLRKELGRSIDRADALMLSCWEPLSLREQQLSQSAQQVVTPNEYYRAPLIDPYAGRDGFR